MVEERIERYKKQARLSFADASVEGRYREFHKSRGRSTSVYSLFALAAINLCLALLEHFVLAIDTMLPLIGYSVLALVCLALAFLGVVSRNIVLLKTRMLVPGVLTVFVLVAAIMLEQYRVYHAFEFALLLIWFGSLNTLGFALVVGIAGAVVALFSGFVYFVESSPIKFSGLLLVEALALVVVLLVSYMQERMRRMLFLTTERMADIHDRTENWAYTLIDLDMALSGIQEFPELIKRLMEHLGSSIEHEAYMLTSLEDKGPKPEPDALEGTLFRDEESTLWSESLLTKLAQTRQADISAEYETRKGFLGREQKHFNHFRMDIPVFNDSSMVGVISLRRTSEPFDDLDATAAVSLSTQAMMIYKRSTMASQMSETVIRKATELVRQHKAEQAKTQVPERKEIQTKQEVGRSEKSEEELADSSPTTYDIEITGATDATDSTVARSGGKGKQDDDAVIPKEVVRKMQEKSNSGRSTITLLSRENADKIAIDRYRTAAVEGDPLSILLFEVDGLSSIREQDGDQAAYKVFAGIVKHIFSRVNPDTNVLGRYGQNGLSVLMPGVDMNAAEKFAESVRQHIEQVRFRTPYGERTATVSVGVAAITDETGNYESMVKRADMALFVAKKNGRNCVKVRL